MALRAGDWQTEVVDLDVVCVEEGVVWDAASIPRLTPTPSPDLRLGLLRCRLCEA